jgi:hypothetical protein
MRCRPGDWRTPRHTEGGIDVSGVHWLEHRKSLDRALRWLEILTGLMVMAMLITGLIVYAWVRSQPGSAAGSAAAEADKLISYLLLIGGLAVLLIFPIVLPVTRALRRKIGTDGKRIHLRLNDGRNRVLAPSSVTHSPRSIYYRQYSFPLRDQKGKSYYREGELETHLEPLLQQANGISPWQGLRHQWKNRDSILLWPLASGVLLTVLLGLVALLHKSHPAQ